MESEARAPTSPPSWLRGLAFLGVPLLLVAAVCVVFAPALDAGFLHWDDDTTLTGNPNFRGFAREQVEWMFTTGLLGHYQPLAWLTFALDHTLDPLLAPDLLAARTFHRTNIVWHAATSLAVYWTSLELLALALRRRRLDPAVVFGAVFASLVFALHPLRVESVAWVTERRDLVSGTFFALALVAWLRFGKAAAERSVSPRSATIGVLASALACVLFLASVERGSETLAWRGPGAWGLAAAFVALAVGGFACAPRGARTAYFLSLACLLVSLGAKAWGMVLPVLFLCADLGPLARASSPKSFAARLAEKAPHVAVALAFALLAAWAQSLRAYTQPDLASHTLVERVAQAGYGVVFYPWKTLAPTGLVALVELPNDLSLASLRFGVPLALACLATLGACAAFTRLRLVSLAWFAYLATIAPVLGFLQSGPQLVADRYAYLALLPLVWLVAGGAARLFARGGNAARLVGGVAVAWIAFLGVAAERQTRVWHDDLALWSHAYALVPNGAEVQKQLAFAYLQAAASEPDLKRRFDFTVGARELLERVAKVKLDARLVGNLALAHRSLAVLDPAQSDEHADLALAFARDAVARARTEGLDVADYRMNLGAILSDRGEHEAALAEYEAVTREKPSFGAAWTNLGLAATRLERVEVAEAAFLRAAELLPRSPEPWRHLGALRESRGDRAGARAAYERGLALAPADAALVDALARVR